MSGTLSTKFLASSIRNETMEYEIDVNVFDVKSFFIYDENFENAESLELQTTSALHPI